MTVATHGKRVVAYIGYRGEPGEGAWLVYAAGAGAARRLLSTHLACDAAAITVQRHPGGDDPRQQPRVVADPAGRALAGLAEDDPASGLECPSCGNPVGDDNGGVALCLCPYCGFRICEGQI
jgi:hypothetical protein